MDKYANRTGAAVRREAGPLLDPEGEVWKPVPGLPLKASNAGRVRNSLTGCTYRPGRQTNGYLMICIWIDGKRRTFRVHKLVCEAFHGPAPEGHECDHRNHRRDDNHPDNLRWRTPLANKADRRFARGERHGGARLTAARVEQIRTLFATMSDTAIGRRFGVHRRTIGDIRNGVTWQ